GDLSFTAAPVASKPPPYSPHRNRPRQGDNIGMRIFDPKTGRTLFYAPGLVEIEPHIRPFLEHADCLSVHGNVWPETEMITPGVSKKRAREIGHLPQAGAGGMIEVLKSLKASRRVLIHINNTNPILNEDSPEHRELGDLGIELAYDGMDITL